MKQSNYEEVRKYAFGSSKEGSHHWWMQRLTAVFLIPLVIWFLVFMTKLSFLPVVNILVYLSMPFNSILAITMICVAMYHASLGVRVIIEDYIHSEFLKNTLMFVLHFVTFFTMVAGIVAMLFYHISYYVILNDLY